MEAFRPSCPFSFWSKSQFSLPCYLCKKQWPACSGCSEPDVSHSSASAEAHKHTQWMSSSITAGSCYSKSPLCTSPLSHPPPQAHRSTFEEAQHHSSTQRKSHTSQKGRKKAQCTRISSITSWVSSSSTTGRDFWAPARKPKQIWSFSLQEKVEEKIFPKRNGLKRQGTALIFIGLRKQQTYIAKMFHMTSELCSRIAPNNR